MQPVDIQVIGAELAIKWSDGAESFIALETLRRRCPCAGCQGEVDVLGGLHKAPQQPLNAQSFQLRRIESIGGYALQPVWGDGHATGLYAFAYLRRLGES